MEGRDLHTDHFLSSADICDLSSIAELALPAGAADDEVVRIGRKPRS